MATTSVSLPNEEFAKLLERQLSPSKVFRLGLEISLMGGKGAFEKIKEKSDRLEREVKNKEKRIVEMQSHINEMKEELAYVRGKLVQKERG